MSLKDDDKPERLSVKDKIKKFQEQENNRTDLKPGNANFPGQIRTPSPRRVNLQNKDRKSNCDNNDKGVINRQTTGDTHFDDSSDFIDIQQAQQCELYSSDIRLEDNIKSETTYVKRVPEEAFLQRNQNSITTVSSRTREIDVNNLLNTCSSSTESSLHDSVTQQKRLYPDNSMDSGYPSHNFSPMPNRPPPIGFEGLEQQSYYPPDNVYMPMPMPGLQNFPSPYSSVHPPKQMSVDSYFGGGNQTNSGRSAREISQQPSIDSYFGVGNPTYNGRSPREIGQQPQKFSNFEIPIETSNDQQKSKSLKVTVQVEMSENT